MINVIKQIPNSLFLALLGICSAVIVGIALGFEHIGGYIPCDLCLEQRIPYYIGAPAAIGFAILIHLSPSSEKRTKLFLYALVTLFIISAFLGARHAGIEWGFLPAPSGCSGGGVDESALDMGNLLNALENDKIVPCDKANWRLLGLSFAGYNTIASTFLAIIAIIKARLGHRAVAYLKHDAIDA